MNFLTNLFLVLPLVFSTLFISQKSNAAVPEDFVSESSKAVEAKMDPVILDRFQSWGTQTPGLGNRSFCHGLMFNEGGNLVWRDKGGINTTLVSKDTFPQNHSLSGFMISPDCLKVAYYTTVGGQDLKHWHVVSVSKTPEILTDSPMINRMQGFSWNKNSTGLYYTFFHGKEEASAGLKPILDVRYRDLNNPTAEDSVVFSKPEWAENFEIADIDGGNTLIAYRLLNPSLGIKTTFSMMRGLKQEDGTYNWESIYPRNEYVGVFLGVYDGKALVLTSQSGNNYGVISVDPHTKKIETLVQASDSSVLHTAQLVGDKLVLQYHTVPEQDVSVSVVSLNTGEKKNFNTEELGLMPFGTLTDFSFDPGQTVSRAIFQDVFKGDQVLELNLESKTLDLLPNSQSLDFDASKVQQRLFSFTAEDGTNVTGRLYTRKNTPPEFVFLRYYGWISIKNSPEPREVQMALELGGAYVTIDLPGGGERGADWFIDGSRNRLKMVKLIQETSRYMQQELNLNKDKVVAMGRSWGGLTSLVLAAKHSSDFGMINPVVPIIDLNDMFENGWFGRIAHSDLAPLTDENGDYILDEAFWSYVNSIDPLTLLSEIPNGGTEVNLFTNGLDDRVDQGGEQEANFAYNLMNQIGADSFNYHRSIKGNHSGRFYQALIFSLIKEKYGLTYKPLSLQREALTCKGVLTGQ